MSKAYSVAVVVVFAVLATLSALHHEASGELRDGESAAEQQKVELRATIASYEASLR
jgi:hypothetical protein